MASTQKHIGRDRLYEEIEVAIFRKPFRAPKEKYQLMGVARPYYVKSRAEIPGIFRAIAQANASQGMYDWGFRFRSLGWTTHKTVEDVNTTERKQN